MNQRFGGTCDAADDVGLGHGRFCVGSHGVKAVGAVADALDTPLSVIMGEVSDRLAIVEGLSVTLDARVPDTVPADLVSGYRPELLARR